ncbi:MAG: transposase [Nitrosomonadales bacterium]|nr:transposase [Nitrosomonadales bacterium]
MNTTTLARNGVSAEMVDLISRLVDLIPWPERRRAMGDVTLLLLDGKHRVAEDVFGWGRYAVEVGIKEFQTGISCVNDISARLKPKTEEKNPELMSEIRAIMGPHSESEPGLRTALLCANMTAKAVYDALVGKGWTEESLPTVRTISNIMNRQGYRLRTAAKTRVQKKPQKPMQSLENVR